ncbi:MAG: hypothetical protein A2315_08720 [Ignavibacteria bacterium RIFOXYB2_FULL_35_12]|nr:MAG: hypothetical protein A2058_12695 [Ignavibacteria bacterium GWA2_36_19]OGU49411.1 MAG: hypothetical protein A2006_11005 [Ignavibacteria bacterium GWC2_35_8]OGU59734.1 MAG: hypothetical protein A2X60_10240 [Ignavibacteria bacterium GWF2_35_20]OGU85202.1 MAG: hypothetical protein A3K31_11700 [Ignavibacteria bacterium RIFOXYA12_FULL_35_25]OGU91787.1 MAG: hypothetical protein A2492_07410 [Ignavibacteria bacterium RIFOXYC12_FULL_35_11]OGU97445.1 MAG: hypothetical protein A2347_15340 [Ignavib
MEVTKKKVSLLRQSFPLFLGFIIVLLAVANFYLILQGVYGIFTSDELIPNINTLHTFFTSQKQKVAILNSIYTKNLLPEGSTWLEDNLKTWEKFTNNFGYEYEIISDDLIETNGLSEFDLLILPGSKSLSDKEIIRIKKYLEQGGNVLATSGTASYSNDGKWRGWNFFSEVFGIRFAKEIKSDEISKVHTIRGGLPLTANIPAGYSLRVATWDRPIAAEVLEPRSIQVSYWYNYKYEEGLVREEIKKSAGIVYGEYGKGRFIWMGFEINSIIGSIDNHVYLERLLGNSLNWLCRNPIAYVRDWPNDFNAAAIFLPYFGTDFSSTYALLDIVKKKKISPTFVIDQDQIRNDNKHQLKLLSQYGEIIPAIAFGFPFTLYDTTRNLFDYQTQFQSITRCKSLIEEIAAKKVTGVLPMFGLYDKSTLKALTSADCNYLISDSINGNSLPKTLSWKNQRIIGMYKSSRDDNDIIGNFGLTDSVYQFYTYQEDIDRLLFEGGLYMLKSISSYQLQPQNINVINNVIDDLRKKNYWIATASEISSWFNTKTQIEVGVKRMGSRRVRLTVSNSGESIAEKIEVDADLSEIINNILLSTEIIGTKLPKFKKLNGGSLIRLTIDELKPHESRIYYIDYDNTKNI